ncbi:MAG TPA: RDD family protein [Pyrinomonadaceae bacterium]|nr:RDD family protein [Pyrinomonadaceae bacterium]
MSAKAERTVLPKNFSPKRIVVRFDAERLKAPIALRCGAILIDYILLVIFPVAGLLTGRFVSYDGMKPLNNEFSNAGWLIMILLALTNFVLLPLFSGQSVGKFLTGLKVVKTDGGEPELKNLILRHLVGYPIMFLTFGLGFLISLFNKKGRALHDFLAGTIVVYGQKRQK